VTAPAVLPTDPCLLAGLLFLLTGVFFTGTFFTGVFLTAEVVFSLTSGPCRRVKTCFSDADPEIVLLTAGFLTGVEVVGLEVFETCFLTGVVAVAFALSGLALAVAPPADALTGVALVDVVAVEDFEAGMAFFVPRGVLVGFVPEGLAKLVVAVVFAVGCTGFLTAGVVFALVVDLAGIVETGFLTGVVVFAEEVVPTFFAAGEFVAGFFAP
jgi:hypothetical protein